MEWSKSESKEAWVDKAECEVVALWDSEACIKSLAWFTFVSWE